MAKSISVKLHWYTLLKLFCAGLVNAIGVSLFLAPSGVLDGGISGLSVLLNLLTKVPLGVYVAVINLPFFIVAFKKMGWRFIVSSLVAVLSYSMWSLLFQQVWQLDKMVYELIKEDTFLCAIFGGLISGLGSGLTIRFGGAIDGIEVTAVMTAKRIGMSVGQFVMVFNVIMYVAACVLLKNFYVGLYSIVTYAVGSKAVDFVVDGLDKGKGCFIVTSKEKEVAEALSSNLGRGITILDSKGYYSNVNRAMLYCVVNRFEIGLLKTVINQTDPTAFVTISDISEILNGNVKFNAARPKKKLKKIDISVKDIEILPNASEDKNGKH